MDEKPGGQVRAVGTAAAEGDSRPGSQNLRHGAADSNVRFHPRHDHRLMGAAFGIRTDAEGSSTLAAIEAPASTGRPGCLTLRTLRIAAFAATLAGLGLFVHAAVREPSATWWRSAGAFAGVSLLAAGAIVLAAVLRAKRWANRGQRPSGV